MTFSDRPPHQPVPLTVTSDWPTPNPHLLEPERPVAPDLPIGRVLSAPWAHWVRVGAKAKSAPLDDVMATLLGAVGSLIGDTRWVSPWNGWAEPPVLWAYLIGNPSSGKSPALDAVLTPLRAVERRLRDGSEAEVSK
jgi:hypothetical protein